MSNHLESLLVAVRVNYLLNLISIFTLFLCFPENVTTVPGKRHISEILISKRARSPHRPDSGITSPKNQQFLTPTSPGQPSTSHPPGIETLFQTKIQPPTYYTTKVAPPKNFLKNPALKMSTTSNTPPTNSITSNPYKGVYKRWNGTYQTGPKRRFPSENSLNATPVSQKLLLLGYHRTP